MKLLTRKQKLNLDKTKRYLLACSGGPDSMALFDMLVKEQYDFEVAFVNYKTRIESDLEEKLVKNYCEKYSKTLHILEKKCSSAENFESEARKIRYNFFENILFLNKSLCGLLVAHNADDSIETYLIQKERNNLPETYGLEETGIFRNFNVFRPLIRYEKAFLTKYCDKYHVLYSIDRSNYDKKYQRNRIRIDEVSLMDVDQKNNLLNEIEQKNKENRRLFTQFDKQISGRFATINYKNIEVLQRFLFYFVKKQGNYTLNSAFKNVLSDVKNKNFNKLYDFETFKLIYDSEGLMFFTCEIDQIDYTYTKEEFNKIAKCNFEEDVLIKPLKNFKEFTLNHHTKKVNRFFIDCKMPLSIRLIWPCVLIDKNTIIFVPRYRKNYKNKDDSKLLFSVKTLQNLNIF